MDQIESLAQFYRHKFVDPPEAGDPGEEHFNIFSLDDKALQSGVPVPYIRRNFYKISLTRGEYVYHYAEKSLRVNGSTLMFFNPSVPYKYECHVDHPTGYFCIFQERFFSEYVRTNIKELPMFKPGAQPAYLLNEAQDQQVAAIFVKMQQELRSDYAFKYDLIRSYISEIVHTALKLEPSETLYQHTNANVRITAVFTELLERQFPIAPDQPLTLRSASDFARQLNVHTNHLNRAVRSTTGKTTTTHIAERLTAEAKALLTHTNWNVSDISYSLGFEDPAHFSHFFKKQTHTTPGAYRG